MKSSTFFLALSAAAVALAAPADTMQKRTPSDKSGKTKMAFSCDDTTLPQPGGAEGQGEGGFGIFSTNMVLTSASGEKIHPSSCKKKDGYCSTCDVKGGGLADTISVTGCSNPAGGACSIEFNYKGYDYNSEKKQPKCGHEGGGFQAFSNTKTAICYFDV